MRIYSKSMLPWGDAWDRFVGKDLWVRCEDHYRQLSYIKIISVDGDWINFSIISDTWLGKHLADFIFENAINKPSLELYDEFKYEYEISSPLVVYSTEELFGLWRE